MPDRAARQNGTERLDTAGHLQHQLPPICVGLRSGAPRWAPAGANMTRERVILAGGCFWGMQQLFRRRDGVIATRVGYSGGDVSNATYRNHGTHAEAIEVIFDSEKLGFRELLEFFFQVHDPSTRNRQGNDTGTSYRSAIFYTSEEQKRIAEETIAEADATGLWPGKIVTELAPAGAFWEAEPEHQDYLERRPDGYTCHYIRPDWVLPGRKAGPAAGMTGTTPVARQR
jgi:peptide-methionine (S)-S-oxide reductase